MTGEPKVGAFGAAIAMSMAVHVGAGAAFVLAPVPMVSDVAYATMEIDFSLEPEPNEDRDEPEPELLPELEPEPLPPAIASLVLPNTADTDAIVDPTLLPRVEDDRDQDDRDDEVDEDDEDDDREDDPRPSPRVMPSLDPASVAAAAMIFDAPTGPTDRAGPRTTDRTPGPDARAMEREIDSVLSAAGNARPHVSHRGAPELHARSDGTYVFRGHAFSAVIRRDGTVRFSDQDGVAMDELSVTRPNGMVPSGRFDLTDSVMRSMGNDPYQHERAWFMRETEALRDQLGDRAHERESRQGMSQLRRSLRTLWDGAGAAAPKRARLFAMWDECAEDEQGDFAREAIRSFVSENLPEGSRDAYSDTELAALNRRRESRARFSPYH